MFVSPDDSYYAEWQDRYKDTLSLIRGHIGGMCWTGEGGCIPGWRESYVHVITNVDAEALFVFAKQRALEINILIDVGGQRVGRATSLAMHSGGASFTVAGTESGQFSRGGLVNVHAKVKGLEDELPLYSGQISDTTASVSFGRGITTVNCVPNGIQSLGEEAEVAHGSSTQTFYRNLLTVMASLGHTGPIILSYFDAPSKRGYEGWSFSLSLAIVNTYSMTNLYQTHEATSDRGTLSIAGRYTLSWRKGYWLISSFYGWQPPVGAAKVLTDDILISATQVKPSYIDIDRRIINNRAAIQRLNFAYQYAKYDSPEERAAQTAKYKEDWARLVDDQKQMRLQRSRLVLGRASLTVRLDPTISAGTYITIHSKKLNFSGPLLVRSVSHNSSAAGSATTVIEVGE